MAQQTILRRAIGMTLATLLVITGCGPSGPEAEAPGADAVTVQNCDREVTVEGPPERVYAAYQPAIEIAHALGLSDRLIGTGFLDAEVLPEFAEAQAELDYTSRLPSRDGMLALEPDFILSGYNNVFAEDGGSDSIGTRGSLADLGVESWILSPLCPSEDGKSDEAIDPATVRIDTIYQDLRDLGQLFDVEERAEALIADQEDRIAAVGDTVDGLTPPSVAILLIDADGGYRVASGVDFGTQIIEHAGGENLFDDLTERRHVEIDIEELIRRDPDVILTSVCCDADMTEADGQAEVDAFVADPAFAGLTAVQDDRVHAFLFANRAAGIRAAHAVELVAELLHPDQYAD